MRDIEGIAAQAIGAESEQLGEYNKIKGAIEDSTKLFPVDLFWRTGSDIWMKFTDWNVKGAEPVDANSKGCGRITNDFQVAPFFEDVRENEGGRRKR